MRRLSMAAVAAALALALSFAGTLPSFASTTLVGIASWYGPGFHGRTTANGERYDMNGLSAAHKSLPFGTKVKVTNTRNGKSVVVRINDRGPYIRGRVIDLSKGAASAIGLIAPGTAEVRIDILT